MSVVLSRVQEGYTYKGDLDLKVMTCPLCGVTYAIPLRMQENARDRGEGRIQWYCPNGHQLGYHGPSAADEQRERAEREQRRANAERDLRADTERRLAAQRGATTRAKKRTAAAVCPCCHRSFSQLRRHMASKHPDYDPEHTA
jgi:hypothetical protein